MFFRRQKGQYRETDRVTRFKLIKSGKHWLRAATSHFGLFKVMRGRVELSINSKITEVEATTFKGEQFLKGIAVTGAILGGGVTSYSVYAEEAPIVLEKTVAPDTDILAIKDEVVLGNAQDIQSSQTEANLSLSELVSESLSSSNSLSLSVSTSESVSESESVSASVSASASMSTSASISMSTSTSSSMSASESTSISNLTSTSSSYVASQTSTFFGDVTSSSTGDKDVVEEVETGNQMDVSQNTSTLDVSTIRFTAGAQGQAISSTSVVTASVEKPKEFIELTAVSQKRRQEQEKQLKALGDEIASYLTRVSDTPENSSVRLLGQESLQLIDAALHQVDKDLTEVIETIYRDRNIVVNAVLRASSG